MSILNQCQSHTKWITSTIRFCVLYVWLSMIPKMKMFIIMICSKSCMFSEWGRAGLLEIVPTTRCHISWWHCLAGKACSHTGSQGLTASAGWPHHSQLLEEVQTREEEKATHTEGRADLELILLICLTQLLAFTWHASNLWSYFHLFPLSHTSLNPVISKPRVMLGP